MSDEKSKEKFLSRLSRRLKVLPKEEREEALLYYKEFLEDGSVEELGSPDEAAKQILDQCAIKALDSQEKKGGLKTLWIVLLAVFAAPVAIPVAVALGAVILAVLVSVFAVVLALFVSGAAAVVGAFLLILLAVAAVSSNFINMLMLIGIGFFWLGAGTLIILGTFYGARFIIRLIARLLGRLVRRSDRR